MKHKFNFYAHNWSRLFVLIMAIFVIDGHFYVKYYPQVREFLMNIPIPVLNCYSVPTTVFACPVGTFQHFLVIGFFSFITFGLLLLVGGLIGRWTCGWLCPFGFVQELLHLIPSPKFKIPKWARYIKYIILLVFVVIMPLFVANVHSPETGKPKMILVSQLPEDEQDFAQRETWFCRLICPAGTLGAGIPQVLINDNLKDLVGVLYWWKVSLLLIVLFAAVFSRRPFCTTICPLGAFLGLFNRFSLLKLTFIEEHCYNCNLCERDCPMGLDPRKDYRSPECIRCMNCVQKKCFAIRKYASITDEVPKAN